MTLLQAVYNTNLAIQVYVRPIRENPIGAFREALLLAISHHDDVLTQHAEAEQLKAAVQTATSFEAMVQVLRRATAF